MAEKWEWLATASEESSPPPSSRGRDKGERSSAVSKTPIHSRDLIQWSKRMMDLTVRELAERELTVEERIVDPAASGSGNGEPDAGGQHARAARENREEGR